MSSNILAIHLDRFSENTTFKNKVGISIPYNIGSNSIFKAEYQLYAICHHLGENIKTGHYIADIYNIYQNNWSQCNDLNIDKLPNPLEPRFTSKTAYILFYIKQDIIDDIENGVPISAESFKLNSSQYKFDPSNLKTPPKIAICDPIQQ